MADRSLRYVVSAVDKNAAKTIGDVATHGSKAASTIGAAFGKLGPIVGGEVGELAQKLTEHLDQLGEHGGKGLAAKLEVGGAAALGIGAALTTMGAAEKQSTDQLDTAITNSGHSFEQYAGKIEDTVGHMEKYGFTAIQTKDSLTTLTNATHDPTTALHMMGEAADLAAARHITLNSAADQLAKTVGGSTRLYKQFGIVVGTNADGTKNLTAAQAQLAALLHGQAASAADNFTGRLKALRAEVTDQVASFGEKYGPAITAAGAAMTLVTPIIKGVGAGMSKLSDIFHSTAETGIAADEAAAASTGELADSVAASTASQTGSFATVAGGAQSASGTAIAADEEAEASTTNLAAAVQASASVQMGAFAEVAGGVKEAAAVTVAADQAMVAANEEVAASSVAAGEGATGAKVGMLGAAGAAGGLAVGVAAVGFAGFKLSSWLERGRVDASGMETAFDNLRTSALQTGGSFDKLGTQVVQQQLQTDGFANRASKAGITLDQLTTGIQGNDAAFTSLVDAWKKSGNPSDDTLFKLKMMRDRYQQAKEETAKYTAATKTQTQALNPLAAALGTTNAGLAAGQKAAAKTAASNAANTLQMRLENNAAGLLSAGLDKLNHKTLDVEQAHIAFRNAEESVTAAVKQNGKALSDNTQKGRDNRTAILDSITAAQQHAAAIATQTGSTVKASAAYEVDIAKLRRHLIAVGLDRDQVNTLIRKYAQVPHLVTTQVDANTQVAKQKAKDYIAWLESLPSVTIGVDFAANRASTRNSQVPQGHAGGSDFFSGGRTLIAEREPEIVDLPRGSTITPMSKIPRGGGVNQVVLQVQLPQTGLYSPEAARYFVSHLESWIRSGGGIKGLTY